MKLYNNTKKQAGLTLIEITLVIAVLLGLISVLFIGVSAYKEGSNRAKCILNISNVQKAVRSYQNLYEKSPGDALLIDVIAGSGKMLETTPDCPSSGVYSTADEVPAVGVVYLTCSLGATDFDDGGTPGDPTDDVAADPKQEHNPKSAAGW